MYSWVISCLGAVCKTLLLTIFLWLWPQVPLLKEKKTSKLVMRQFDSITLPFSPWTIVYCRTNTFNMLGEKKPVTGIKLCIKHGSALRYMNYMNPKKHTIKSHSSDIKCQRRSIEMWIQSRVNTDSWKR